MAAVLLAVSSTSVAGQSFEDEVEAFNACLKAGKSAVPCVRPDRRQIAQVPTPTPRPAEERPGTSAGCWEIIPGLEICPASDGHEVDCRLARKDQVPNVDFCAREDPNRREFEPGTSFIRSPPPEPPKPVEPPVEPPTRPSRKSKKH